MIEVRLAAILAAGCVLIGCQSSSTQPYSASLRGIREIRIDSSGRVVPMIASDASSLGFCVAPAPTVDTSRWQLGWELGTDRSTPQKPTVRLESTLCFTAKPTRQLATGRHQLCPLILEAEHTPPTRLTCLPFEVAHDESAYRERQAEFVVLVKQARQDPSEESLTALRRFIITAEQSEFHVLGMRTRLLLIDLLRRSGRARDWDEVDRLLADAPKWLATDGLEDWLGQFEYQRAIVRLERHRDPRAAWASLRIADRAFTTIASDFWAAPRARQANLVGVLASPREGRQRLSALYQACQRGPCHSSAQRAIAGTLAWQILLDPDSPDRDLQWAETTSSDLAAESRSGELSDAAANRLLNAAMARLRRKLSPDPHLARAELKLTEGNALAGGRQTQLVEWASVLRGLSELQRGAAHRADSLCSFASRSGSAQLAAEGAICRARALRALGRFGAAQEQLRIALRSYASLADEPLDQAVPLGSSQRSSAFYLAAAWALEARDSDQAWELLRGLDLIRLIEEQRQECLTGDISAQLQERNELAAAIEALAFPESRERAEQSRDSVVALRQRLQELIRRSGACRDSPLQSSLDPDLRAFVIDDTVVAIWRRENSAEFVFQITNLAQSERQRLLESIEAADATVSAQEWDRAMLAFSSAIVPPDWRIGRPIRIALYGPLQRLPILALPTGRGLRERWGLRSTLIHHHAVTPAHSNCERSAASQPLFVIDPRQNLASAQLAQRHYRALFPSAYVLRGGESTRSALETALQRSISWLHFDGHGLYDSAFPELSALELADGPLDATHLAAGVGCLELVNLSGCETGRFQVTADSGRHGIAGLLVERGVDWVIATRDRVPDTVAWEFNRHFYQLLASETPIPEAYRLAVGQISQVYPPRDWGALMLVAAAPEKN